MVIDDLFDVPMSLEVPKEKRSSKRKRTFSETMKINSKRKIQLPKEVVNSKNEDVVKCLEAHPEGTGMRLHALECLRLSFRQQNDEGCLH